VVTLDNDEPHIIANMLKFVYGKVYDDGSDTISVYTSDTPGRTPSKAVRVNSSSVSSPLALIKASELDSIDAPLTDAKMFTIGTKYGIPALRRVAKTKYLAAMPDTWNSASFVASLKVLYEEATETDHAMKDIAVEAAGEHARELLGREEFLSLCKENGEIAVNVMKTALMDPLKQPCASCRAMCSRTSTWV